MAKMTPMQAVQQRFGSKEKLVAQLVSSLKPFDGESKDEFQARLLEVSNRKLLRLAERAEALKTAGGFDALAAKVTELEGGNKDRLEKNKRKTIGTLLDRKKSLKG